MWAHAIWVRIYLTNYLNTVGSIWCFKELSGVAHFTDLGLNLYVICVLFWEKLKIKTVALTWHAGLQKYSGSQSQDPLYNTELPSLVLLILVPRSTTFYMRQTISGLPRHVNMQTSIEHRSSLRMTDLGR